MIDRKKIMDKIRALMSKTVDNGCTKAEAISADSMIKKLVGDYNITSADWRWYFWGDSNG